MFIVAGVLAFLAFVFLLVAGAYGIVAAGLPVWAGFLIVAGVLLVVTAILALVGRSKAKKISPPDRAKSQSRRPSPRPRRPEGLLQSGVEHPAVTLLDPEDVVRPEGPWTHRDVPANGSRFHVAEMGPGPWCCCCTASPRSGGPGARRCPCWRGRASGQRPWTCAATRARPPAARVRPLHALGRRDGVIRSLGARNAVVVGHGWGGFLAWTAAALQPEAIRAIAPMSMPHPRRLREALLGDSAQRRPRVRVRVPGPGHPGARPARGWRRRGGAAAARRGRRPPVAGPPRPRRPTGRRCCC